MIVIMAEATGAADELPEHSVTQRVAPPPLRVAALDLLGLLPALLLHAEGEAPRVGALRRDLEGIESRELIGEEVAVDERRRGRRRGDAPVRVGGPGPPRGGEASGFFAPALIFGG